MTTTRKPTPEARPQLTSAELPIRHGHGFGREGCERCDAYRKQNAANLGRTTTVEQAIAAEWAEIDAKGSAAPMFSEVRSCYLGAIDNADQTMVDRYPGDDADAFSARLGTPEWCRVAIVSFEELLASGMYAEADD